MIINAVLLPKYPKVLLDDQPALQGALRKTLCLYEGFCYSTVYAINKINVLVFYEDLTGI